MTPTKTLSRGEAELLSLIAALDNKPCSPRTLATRLGLAEDLADSLTLPLQTLELDGWVSFSDDGTLQATDTGRHRLLQVLDS